MVKRHLKKRLGSPGITNANWFSFLTQHRLNVLWVSYHQFCLFTFLLPSLVKDKETNKQTTTTKKNSLAYAKIGNISEFVTDSLNVAPSQRSPTLDYTPSLSNESLRYDGEKTKILDTYICTCYGNEKDLKPKIRPRLTPTRWTLQCGGKDCVGRFRKSHLALPKITAPRPAVPLPLPLSSSQPLVIMTRRGASPLCRQPLQDKHPLQLDRETALWTRRICIIQLTDRKLGWQSLCSIVSTLVGNTLVCKLTQWTIMAPSNLVQYRVSAAAMHAR